MALWNAEDAVVAAARRVVSLERANFVVRQGSHVLLKGAEARLTVVAEVPQQSVTSKEGPQTTPTRRTVSVVLSSRGEPVEAMQVGPQVLDRRTQTPTNITLTRRDRRRGRGRVERGKLLGV